MEIYVLYMQERNNFTEFKKFILHQLELLAKEIEIKKNNEHECVAYCSAFLIRVRDKSLKMDITKEEYNMDLDYEIWFDLYYSEDQSTYQMMMKFMETLICKNQEQCIVLFNGCRSVLERRNKVIIGDRSMLPYLNVKYIDQKLE